MTKDYRVTESMETMASIGVTTLTTEDLLSIIIGSHVKAEKLLHQEVTLLTEKQDELKYLAEQDFDSLKYVCSLTKAEAARILAAMELGKRIANIPAMKSKHISSPGDAAKYLMPALRYETHEKFLVMLLNTKNHLIRIKQIAEGSLASAVVHPREVYAPAVVAHAASIVVAHNHPSGDPYPGKQDRSLTRALEESGKVLGIPLVDHLIIGDGRYYSFKEHAEL